MLQQIISRYLQEHILLCSNCVLEYLSLSLFSSLHQPLDERLHNLWPLRRQSVLQRGFLPQLWPDRKYLLWLWCYIFPFCVNLKVISCLLGTCTETCVLSSSLWNHQGQLSVNPPLHRSDHVTLGALQQFVKLRGRRRILQSINMQESNAVSSCTVPARLSHQPLKLQGGAGETGCQKLRPRNPAPFPFVEPELSCWGKRFQLCKASTDNLNVGLKSVFKTISVWATRCYSSVELEMQYSFLILENSKNRFKKQSYQRVLLVAASSLLIKSHDLHPHMEFAPMSWN